MDEERPDRADKSVSVERLPKAYQILVYRAWMAWKGEAVAPPISSLDPAAFPAALPYLTLIRIDRPAGRARVGLVGEGVVQAVGVNFSGHYMDEIPGNELARERIRLILETRQAYLDLDDPMEWSPLNYKRISVLSLPFLDDAGEVDTVLLALSFSS